MIAKTKRKDYLETAILKVLLSFILLISCLFLTNNKYKMFYSNNNLYEEVYFNGALFYDSFTNNGEIGGHNFASYLSLLEVLLLIDSLYLSLNVFNVVNKRRTKERQFNYAIIGYVICNILTPILYSNSIKNNDFAITNSASQTILINMDFNVSSKYIINFVFIGLGLIVFLVFKSKMIKERKKDKSDLIIITAEEDNYIKNHF